MSDRTHPAFDTVNTPSGALGFYRLDRVVPEPKRLPYVVRVFLENAIRRLGSGTEQRHVDMLASWPNAEPQEFPFFPARVIFQDFTGVPVVADLAAMRAAVARL